MYDVLELIFLFFDPIITGLQFIYGFAFVGIAVFVLWLAVYLKERGKE